MQKNTTRKTAWLLAVCIAAGTLFVPLSARGAPSEQTKNTNSAASAQTEETNMTTETSTNAATENAALTEADFKNAIAFIEKCKKDKNLSYAAFAVGNRSGELFHWCLDGTTEDTLFDMASVTKLACTTTLFLIAQSEGMVHWDDPLSKYFDAPADKADLPLWRFLSHTSGISNYKFYNLTVKPDPADANDYILSAKLGYTPGTAAQYSCINYILIGQILEKVYGKPLDVLYTEKIAEPLKLKNTGFKLYETDAQIAVHQKNRNRVNDGNATFLGGVAGNAGLFSTITDMSAYAVELANGFPTLNIPKQMFVDAIQLRTPGMSWSVASGFLLVHEKYVDGGNLFPVGSYGHSGHTGQSIFVDPQTGLWVVFLTNLNYHNAAQTHALRGEFHSALAEDLRG